MMEYLFFLALTQPFHCYLRKSKLARLLSRLGRTELLELLLLLALCSDGSDGFKPVDLAKRFRTSVRETTPVKRPERCAPGSAAAGTEDAKPGLGSGDCGTEFVPDVGGMRTVGVMPPVPVAPPMPVATPSPEPFEDEETERMGWLG